MDPTSYRKFVELSMLQQSENYFFAIYIEGAVLIIFTRLNLGCGDVFLENIILDKHTNFFYSFSRKFPKLSASRMSAFTRYRAQT